jgi:ATP-dependent Lhr-like helicase
VNEAEIKMLLKRTYGPFFGSFGRMTPIQSALIPPLMKGKNAVGVSPPASGKTEAALGPMVERVLTIGVRPLSILYVAPTRALINDIEKRIRGPLGSVGLSLSVRTGDRPELRTTRPENVLLTTPESLDSLLCRYPRIWEDTRAVILDEIHLLDNTYRGDQLRILLRRLEKWHTEKPLQYCALSSTISQPENLASRYFESATVVRAGTTREISLHLFPDMEMVIRFLRQNKYHKALIFCNSRKNVEELALRLKTLWPRDRVLVHHGSLSRKERESVEEAMRTWQWGLCVCTMTMELGIDIGNIDAVVLYGPPHTPSAFIQRVGRAGRRGNEMLAVGCYRNRDDERVQFEIYSRMAQKGLVERIQYTADISVCVQQVFSLLFAMPGGLRWDDMRDMLSPLCEADTFKAILLHLTDIGFLEESLGRCRATTKLMDMAYRGFIHSNIPQIKDFRIIDADTERVIGELLIEAAVGSHFVLSGKVWQILQVKAKQRALIVRRIGPLDSTAHFTRRYACGAFSRYLPKELMPSAKIDSS